MRIFANADFPFLQWRRRAYIVTAVLLLGGLGAMVANILEPRIGTWLKYGVDFTGGRVAQVVFDEAVPVERIRAAAGESDWEITNFGSDREFLIRMPNAPEQTGVVEAQTVEQTLEPAFGEGAFQVVRTEAVGPKVGNELQQRALLAILLSLVVVLAYLAFRFEWRFGVAAVIATSHDMLITLGFLAVLRTEISVATVAALLTVIGYSLNDTIVVFDRIRENLAKPTRGASYSEILNRSINETLPRTVLTGCSTLGTLFALFFFGGSVIRDFALVLILGILIGTFSSIFVASPALNAIHNRWPPKSGRTGRPATGTRSRETAVV